MKTYTYSAQAATNDGRLEIREALELRFSPYRLFSTLDNDAKACLRILGADLAKKAPVALIGAGPLAAALLEASPELTRLAPPVVALPQAPPSSISPSRLMSLADFLASPRPETAFLCDPSWTRRAAMRHLLPSGMAVVEPDTLVDLAPKSIPRRAWIPRVSAPYPMEIPAVAFPDGVEMILLDCPGRNLGMMPNGLAYIHAALTGEGIRLATMDLDIIVYHRFHSHRILDLGQAMLLPDGRPLPEDPWAAENSSWWHDQLFVDTFEEDLAEALEALVQARPKVLGVSVHECNTAFTAELVRRFRLRCPESVVLAGGYSCNQAHVGLKAFPECDYMCIGEADLTAGPLVRALLRGERPADLPGVVSRHDSPFRVFEPAPIPMDLDALPRPAYPWAESLALYSNHDKYRLTPVIASRGCRWSRCRFCGECIPWRARDPVSFVDELQDLYEQGRDLFMFNESDFNGSHKLVRAICEEIIRRGLKVRLTGQLRIDRKSTADFFSLLRRAGFVFVRFGVDAWSANTLRIQNKGYTVDIISQNLRDCHAAGIHTEVNAVIGVPGETDQDIEETQALILENRPNIDRIANVNPLMLVVGSVFWREPERYGIRFREDRDAIVNRYPRAVPAHLWYSETPYIDDTVRTARYKKLVLGLAEAGFPMSDFAKKVLTDVSEGTDSVRSGSSAPEARENGAQEKPEAMTSQGFKEVEGALFLHDGKVLAVASDGPSFQVSPPNVGRWFKATLRRFLGAKAEPSPNLSLWPDATLHNVRRTLSTEETQLVRADVLGYNILEVRGEYFALRHGADFDYHDALAGSYPQGQCLRGTSVSQLDQVIQEEFKKWGLPPRMVKPDVGHYNILEAGGSYYAIRHGLLFNSHKADTGGYAPEECLLDTNPDQLEVRIRALR